MKTIRLILVALLLFSAVCCIRETEEFIPVGNIPAGGPPPGTADGQQVTLEFNVPVTRPGTKALGEGGELNTLHLAVFGGSGYLKEYVEAVPVASGTYSYKALDRQGDSVTHVVPCYTYSARITISEVSARTIHFLGNGPSTLQFGYDTKVLPSLLSPSGEMSYWQMIRVPAIAAKRSQTTGNYIDEYGNEIPEGGTGYVIADSTKRYFQCIPLIRNWAKIELSTVDSSNFTPKSLAVVNVPARGSMVPYMAGKGFINNYQNLGFEYLEDSLKYAGNLPVGTTFNSFVPDASAFLPPYSDGVAGVGSAVYLYERPAPSAQIAPSYVIIYGHYDNPKDAEHSGDYFYKVDLMETRRNGDDYSSDYYPIYRNFKYQIIVKKILSQGHLTPAAAAASSGSADVSADITTGHLSDISDGIGRLHIDPWMSQTFTRAYDPSNPVNVLSAYFSQQEDGSPDMDASHVRVETLPPEDGGSPIIYNLEIGAPSTAENNRGWRPITFCTVGPSLTVRSQSFRITGVHSYGRLYRDVTITVQPLQPMTVSCGEERLLGKKGTKQTVSINIPDGLVASMFPLEFMIEAEDLTLSPDNSVSDNNLPVTWGESISEHEGYAGKTSFHFVKTVTWDDYLRLTRFEDDEDNMWRRITCYFITNRDISGTTVWVTNPYFLPAHTSFTNYVEKTFQNLHFTIPIPQESDQDIPLYFEMTEDPDGIYPTDYPEILIMASGLRCTLPGIRPGPEPETYYYKPSAHSVTLPFVTTTSDGEIAIDLYADDYTDGHVESYKFPFFGLLDGHPLRNGDNWANNKWSNVAFGHVNDASGKFVLFAYKDNPGQINTPVTLTINAGLVGDSNATVINYAPTGPRNINGDIGYHEIELKTTGNKNTDVDMFLSSPGYITEHIHAGRFTGNIRTMRITGSNAFKKDNTYSFTQEHPSFEFSEDSGKCQVSFSSISANPEGYVRLFSGQSYDLTITSMLSAQTLFYVNLMFSTSGSTVYAPESLVPSVGTITRYPGSNNQYVWSIPRGNHSATLSITPPADREVRLYTMYVKAFNGALYSGGVQVP